MAEEKNHNEAGEVAPSNVDKQAPSVAEEHAPSTDSPEATDIPTANAPDPKAVNPETNPNAAKPAAASPKREKPSAGEKSVAAAKAAKAEKPATGEKSDAGEKPAAAKATAKKEKAPSVEDKPFVEFIQQDYLPAVQKAIAEQGVKDLQLSFAKQKVPIVGFQSAEECWQVVGSWQKGLFNFNLYFPEEDIQGKKGFSCYEGKRPSTLESFLIDERKITLDLLVFGLVQRLNGQKWLGLN
ncbi:DUF2996 domain-containing protein [Dendronalium sp. ChiSLP03b]|uniref:DUF2996 domain-containing protein n=1 Tax=Dendronalium sp. ChiSLP03b TaxID=3075381 RepID=UPI002AD52916|nr:DUF2996 domain-containing protein [Dendronalium sp. ChiSLP03b]MDZ8204373.1 DUF2996 domain-containing protein [Dendronalium sp. ChiSLP03b]